MPHLVTRAGVKQEDELYALFACRSVTRLVTRPPCPGMGGQLVMKEPSLLFGSLQLKIPLEMAVSESGRTLDYTVEPSTCNCLHVLPCDEWWLHGAFVQYRGAACAL